MFLKISQNSQEKKRCQSCRPLVYDFIKKETVAQVLSCEFCRISMNTFFNRTLPVVAFDGFVSFSNFSGRLIIGVHFQRKLSQMYSRKLYKILKLVSAIFYQIFIFSPNDGLLKTMKIVFYSIQKALFVLELFKFL